MLNLSPFTFNPSLAALFALSSANGFATHLLVSTCRVAAVRFRTEP